MNKKLEIICLVFAVLLSNILYANDTPCHVSGFSNGYRVFYGFDFGEPKISDHDLSIEGIVNEEINCVLNDDAANNNTSDYAIVGHSQGGLRVLAYASMLKEREDAQESYDRLKAVITVSGIDRGLKALDGGFAPFRAKVLNDGEILGNGLIGVGGSCMLGAWADAVVILVGGTLGVPALLYNTWPYIFGYVGAGWIDADYETIPEIYDMMPESNFIRTHVAESVKNTYKVQTGTKTTLEVRYKKVLFVNVPYVVTVTTPVYETIVNYTDKLKIDDDLPIGYIVGVNSNSLSMALDEETEANVRTGIAAASTVMKIAQGINLVKYCGSLGLLSSHKTYATYCENAANWLDNFDGELNELKGSSENDGLVAKESQYYPMSAHSNVLGNTDKGYVAMDYNHAEIDPTTNEEVQEKIKDMIKKLVN